MKLAYRIFLPTVFAFLVSISSFSSDPLPGQIAGIYGLSNYASEMAICLAETSNGGFIICGQSLPGDADWSHILVVYVDNEGKATWSKEFGEYGSYVYAITKTEDSAFIMVGYSYEVGMLGAFLVKFDESGNLIWQKAYGPNAWAYDIKTLPDGDFLVVGGMLSEDRSKMMGLLMKVDANGNAIWHRAIENKDDPKNDAISLRGLIPENNGEFIVWGDDLLRDDYGKTGRSFLLRFNCDGTLLWGKALGSWDFVFKGIHDILETPQGDILMATEKKDCSGEYLSVPYLICLSHEGILKWAKTPVFEEDPYCDSAISIYNLFARDGSNFTGFVNMHYKYYGKWYYGPGFLEFNISGEINPTMSVSSFPYLVSPGYESKPTIMANDGNIAYAPTVEIYGDRSNEFGLVKTDSANQFSGNCTLTEGVGGIWVDDDTILENITNYERAEATIGCSEIPSSFARESSATGVNTFCPVITQINKLQNPFRLEILGSNFISPDDDLQVTINNIPVPTVTCKSSQRVIAKKGRPLKKMLPKGVPVCIQIRAVNGAGVEHPLYKSDCFTFTR